MRRTRIAAAITAFSISVFGLSSHPALAQPTGTLNRFSASETPEDDFHLSRPTDLGHMRFGAQLHVDYANDPLVYETRLGTSDSESLSVVEHQLTGTFGFSLGLIDRVVVFAGLPVVFVMDGASDAAVAPLAVPSAQGAGLGDLYLGARVRLAGEAEDTVALALQGTLTLPTSDVPNESSYRGDTFLTFLPELLLEVRPGKGARIVANVGLRLREPSDDNPINLEFGQELTYGLGFAIPLWRDEANQNSHLDLHAQVYGSSSFALFGDREGTAIEGTAGVKYFDGSGLVAGLAAGPGLTRGFGSPDVRVIGTLGWRTPVDRGDRDGDGILDGDDGCPDDPEDMDDFEDENGCPDPDNDEDNILDVDDQCINVPENINGVDDEDGCPEAGDQDGDGLNDDQDQCPTEPEDFDGFEDENGCPDPDNDSDGVLDSADECRDEPGVIENVGCPDSDRDGDTVVDREDNCPDEPGSVENHGCQDEQQVILRDGRLEILDRVFFRTNRDVIQQRSFPLLMNVARVLNAHPEINLVRVEGHTDARGRYEYNIQLSQKRAEAVVRFLVSRGQMDPSRLQAQGFGPDRPIVQDAQTPEEHAQNRRVEFNIPEQSGIEQQNSAAGSDTTDY